MGKIHFLPHPNNDWCLYLQKLSPATRKIKCSITQQIYAASNCFVNGFILFKNLISYLDNLILAIFIVYAKA